MTKSQELAPLLKESLPFCLLGGLCPLIPLPWLDDWALNHFQKNLLRKVTTRHGLQLSDRDLEILSRGYEEKRGCLLSFFLLPFQLIVFFLLRPAKQVLKKMTVIFAVKEAADMTSRFVHQAVLTDHAIQCGLVQSSPPADASAEIKERHKQQLLATAGLVNRTCSRLDTRPLNQLIKRTLNSSRLLLGSVVTAFLLWARKIRQGLRKSGEYEEFAGSEEELKRLSTELMAELLLKEDYFSQVIRKFEELKARDLA
ncbi:MAG: hypothetical protein HS115_00325 [Spirochaetales bacterium]|nr:hypothetical protein [Spirochaetales bacterium]